VARAAAHRQNFGEDSAWIPVGQGFKDMTPRIENFEALMLSGRLRHGGHPLLNMAAAAAVVTSDPAGGRKLDKSKTTNRIDPLVASVMATFSVSEGLANGVDIAGMIG
jgi:phage terminase large subunit-like protein